MISVLSHSAWLSLISFILKTLYAPQLHHQCMSLGQILLIPLCSIFWYFESLEDLYPNQTAQSGKKTNKQTTFAT